VALPKINIRQVNGEYHFVQSYWVLRHNVTGIDFFRYKRDIPSFTPFFHTWEECEQWKADLKDSDDGQDKWTAETYIPTEVEVIAKYPVLQG
jgi:hypothetical protein